jgi:Fe-S-cluster containining protein
VIETDGTEAGTLRATVELPDRPIRLAELARLVLPLDDRAFALDCARAEPATPVACREGCAACCRQLVPISPAEAFLLADLVDALPEARREIVQARFASRRERVERSWIGYALRHHLAEEGPRATELALAYHKLQLECPFLEDERCSIYEDRPATCREYAVVTRKENCRFPSRTVIRRVPVTLAFSEALGRISAARLGLAEERLPLLDALAWAEAHPSERRRTFPAEPLLESLVEALAASADELREADDRLVEWARKLRVLS